MKEPQGSNHWSHEVIPLAAAGVAAGVLIAIFISFLHADW